MVFKKLGLTLLALLAFFLSAIFWLKQENTPIEPESNLVTNPQPERIGGDQPNSAPVTTPTPPPQPLPAEYTIAGGNHVFQTFNNCGPASLSMTFSLIGQQISQQVLGEQVRPYQNPLGDNDDKSVTLAELAALSREYGYQATSRPGGSVELVQEFIAADIPVITRTWLSTSEDIGHYRVVIGYDRPRQVLIQNDSLQGKELAFPFQDFNEIWQAFNYEFLVVYTPQQEEKVQSILGNLTEEENAWQAAFQEAQQQATLAPSNPYHTFNAAVAAYQLGRYQEAVDLYESVETQLPSRMLWYQIEPILAYYQVGEYDQVLKMTQEIFESQNRAFSELHYLRGLVFEKLGRETEATSSFTAADTYNSSPYWKENLSSILRN